MSPAQVAAFAREVIRPGFLDLDGAVEQVEDFFEDRPAPTDAGGIPAIVAEVWQECLAEQETWADESDSDRMTRAFAALESDGFVPRMAFSCCQPCGHTEIEEERTAGEHSYVFFHSQDAERLAEPGVLHLAYGAFDDHPDLDPDLLAAARQSEDPEIGARAAADYERVVTAVGVRVVEAVRREGLEVAWDGNLRTRPAVTIDDWRRRLPTSP